MACKKLLNVKAHLLHIQLILDRLQEHGHCPILEEECKKASLINRSILGKHARKSTRKDVYVNC